MPNTDNSSFADPPSGANSLNFKARLHGRMACGMPPFRGWRQQMTQWIDDLWHDLRHALRTFQRNPGFPAVALLMLALGIGAATGRFTILNGVLFKTLRSPEPYHLVALMARTAVATSLGNLWAFSYPNFADLHRETKLLDAAAWRYVG